MINHNAVIELQGGRIQTVLVDQRDGSAQIVVEHGGRLWHLETTIIEVRPIAPQAPLTT